MLLRGFDEGGWVVLERERATVLAAKALVAFSRLQPAPRAGPMRAMTFLRAVAARLADRRVRQPGCAASLRRLLVIAAAAVAGLAGGCATLPPPAGRLPSLAFTDTAQTPLGQAVAPLVADHPGLSGIVPFDEPHDAFAARVLLARAAARSLDAQYYIWHGDAVGTLLWQALWHAAQRGVRVRLLLDDLGTMPSDAVLLAIDSHPNIEVRMFNPARLRSLRLLGILADIGRLNKRMHNKAFIADGEVAIVGGRNIGDEYYGANEGANFADLDVAVIGPVVKEVSSEFDLYWNHAGAVPVANLSRQNTTPEQYAAMRAKLAAPCSTEAADYLQDLRNSEFARDLRHRTVTFFWGRATIVQDHPDKVLTSSSRTATHLAPQLRALTDRTQRELFLVSPYFVPGKKGVDLLADVRQRGVRVVVLTNSLAATDGVPVHSGYQRYRRPLIEAGVELYEIKPTATAGRERRSTGLFGSRGAGGSSGSSLHAKTFAFDRRIGFIGSYNLDPRSSRLNTEMGVLFDCPALARQIPETVERDLDRAAYRVGLEDRRLVWTTREDGRQARYTSEPQASLWKRIKSTVLSWLPIEGLL